MSIERSFLPVANKHALSAREKMGLLPDAALCPFKYTEYRGFNVLKLTDLMEHDPRALSLLTKTENRKPVFSATTLLDAQSQNILGFVVNDTHKLERQKSNLAHEWGHVLQAHKPQNLLQSRQEIHSKREEAEADAVGFALLMTDEMCIRMAEEGLSDQDISAKYGISYPVVKLRMNRSYARKIVDAKKEDAA